MLPTHRACTPLAGLLVVILSTACANIRAMPTDRATADGVAPGGQLITQQQILRSGATDGFEAIERAGTHLFIKRSAGGGARISHRGADSFLLGSDILLVVDGSRVTRPSATLRSIPAGSITFIQVLSGREASVRWGSEAGNGVILVRTSAW